ncbi:tRNA pseudouridine(13) synthase TruD [Metallosphaera tengchongensis]|uniref:tRNA pseudouridine(13) synthase TruD n=1 Tax=Metallosphaera tengchongensis TaxID=1532350 RepID=A0A6N0NTK4_9CREN|nr:tRNA pseudouridine(13) synthase TruD [Metallosphaera tengchongensis]QKR00022.1 tRNA pseudouridine(13) synthase TruD [Metallosphaera tengchongensis]
MHLLDIAVGIEVKVHDWKEVNVSVPRPDGFNVIEEVNGKPCDQWVGSQKGKFAVYLVEKRGVDHFKLISRLTKILGEKPSYLGIKDANATTMQIVYVRSKRLDAYTEKNLRIKFLGYTDAKLDHTGNIFKINLVTEETNELEERVRTLKDEMLPAYVGYQRFGTRRPTTHLIGKAITQRDWCQAVKFMLGYPFLKESETMIKFRKDFMSGTISKDQLARAPYRERQVYLELDRSGDCLMALKRFLPQDLSFMVEAYQSYLFNRVLSRKLIYEKAKEDDIITLYTDPSLCDYECREVYEEENIGKNSFKIPELEVNLNNLRRNAFMRVKSLEFKDGVLSFSLDRGMYATVVLSELLNSDPASFT